MSSGTTTGAAKPQAIKMTIHTGMLESLGINMYTSLAKSLVEFIANGFDAEATEVKVTLPSADIQAARKAIKDAAKNDAAQDKRDDFNRSYEPLPDAIEIVVEDNGHGMTVEEVESKFLLVNRNRRKATNSNKSENGLRTVMGRKGLGKLAGFGVAEQVIVTTKRKNETYSTTIEMDFNKIKECESIGDVEFTPRYEEGLGTGTSGTKIVLRRLRCDSLKNKEDSIEQTLARNFYGTGDDFKIFLNSTQVKEPDVDYEFTYPKVEELNTDGFKEFDVKVDDNFSYPVLGVVKFRARKTAPTGGKIRGSLPAYLRGARIYCNKRLAAGPTLFNLETGMHNFHAQSYMECIVHADVLDQQEADLIGTNRSGLKTDNEVVDAFVDSVTAMMRTAIAEHAKFREAEVKKEIEEDPTSKKILDTVSQVSRKNREPAKKILTTIAETHGIDSVAYKEVAPHLVKAINSSEVLVELIKTGVNPESLGTIIEQLHELSSVEKSDVLKLYRGRRHAIEGLQKLEERSHSDSRGPRYENELHDLLKKNPWLIKAEFGGYLSSDDKMGEVARKLTEKLNIDNKAGAVNASDDKRPDLVFVTVDPKSPTSVSVVELKSPNVPLNNDHLSQLEGYMMQIEGILKTDYQNGHVNVTGHLVGNLPRPDTQAIGSQLLLDKIGKAGPATKWEVLTLPQLLTRARNSHQNVIDVLEAEEAEQDDT